ncbi:MAG: fibronectin type III domain-containing protein [Gemmatimonadaceae bacterium]
MQLTRRALAAVAAVLTLASLACGSDGPSGPETVNPIVGVTATAKGATSVTVSFNGNAGDASYDIERAEGAAGAFAKATNVPAPATGGAVTWTDAGLKVNTLYRYRVIANKGSLKSIASGEATATTLAFGNAVASITTDITASRTLYADTTYTLTGFIHVGNGATLTIQAGTTIKGDFNTLGSSLMILKGAKIIAIGTADAPIVFTSSRAAGQRQPGDWGGLLLVGNAQNNRSGAVSVEGTGTDGAAVVGGKNYPVVYNGGNVATDNSGTLQYVRVEFGGYAPVQDQEFNAFTFCAIGSGTRASYLQALAGLDDSYEFFGGGFDIDHLVAFETADDMFDMSEGWSGRMQFLIGINTVQLVPRTGAGSYSVDIEGIENDGCNGPGCDLGFNSAPFTIPLVSNFTLIGCGLQTCMGPSGGHGMMLRRGTGGYYVNGVVARWSADGISLRDSATFVRGGTTQTPSATADLQIRNILFAETKGKVFQTPVNSAPPSTIPPQADMDLAANNLTLSTATAASLFTLLPAVGAAPTSVAAFDFTPVAGSAIATGGLATFTGAILAKAGTVVTPTAYLGAVAPGGTKWWQGWTNYARN